MKDFKVDLVYLWVNGDDPIWGKKYESHSHLRLAYRNRFRDNSELRYSLRSVAQNMKWINTIYIVTDSQKPSWLEGCGKVQIVDHKEIIEDEYLPCFNSEAIELRISKIKGLSERFILASDDCFVYSPITKDFFFDEEGEPIYRFIERPGLDRSEAKDPYYRNLQYCKRLLEDCGFKLPKDVEPQHNMDPYKKSIMEEVQKKFDNEVRATLRKRVRGPNSIQRIIYSLYDIALNKKRWVKALEPEICYFNMTNIKRLPEALQRRRPALYCINDESLKADVHFLPLVLERIYPEKAEWEKKTVLQIRPVFEQKDSVCLVFAPDDNYCKYFSATLCSLIKLSSTSINYDIVILESDISDYNKKLLSQNLPENFSFRFINIFEFLSTNFDLKEFSVRSYWSLSTYYKCLIPLIFESYQRVLFCDADLVFSDDFIDFYSLEFGDKLIAAIKDTITPDLDNHPDRLKELLSLGITEPRKSYFNAGVLLFNLAKIKKQDYENLLRIGLKKQLPFQDQDLLNLIFQDDVKLTNLRYNFQNGVTIYNPEYLNHISPLDCEEYLSALEKPAIIHFTGSIKPWHDPSQQLAFYFWKNARLGNFYEVITSELYGRKQRIEKSIIKDYLRERSKQFFPLHSKRREALKSILKKMGII